MTVEFGNAQSLINRYIESATGITAVTVVPSSRPPRFVRTVRTGGFRRDIVTDVARLTFECWNAKKVDAERDCQAVRAALDNLRGKTLDGVKVHEVSEIAAPADSPDPDSAVPRYVMTHEIALRGRYRKGQ